LRSTWREPPSKVVLAVDPHVATAVLRRVLAEAVGPDVVARDDDVVALDEDVLVLGSVDRQATHLAALAADLEPAARGCE
jgi:hypothetical protein